MKYPYLSWPPRPPGDGMARYRIETRGLLDPAWSAHLDNFTITVTGDHGVLIGLADQDRCFTLVDKLRELSLLIVRVERREPPSELHPDNSG